MCSAPDPVTIEFADGDPISTRYDWVVAQVNDDAEDASGDTAGDVLVVPGDQNAPTMPAGVAYMPLWRVAVPAGASAGTGGIPWASAATDYRMYTGAFGGAIPLPDLAARNRLTNVHAGTLAYVAATDNLYMRTSDGGWEPIAGSEFVASLPIPTVQAGFVNVVPNTPVSDYYRGTAHVTFPTPFSAPPYVVVSGQSSVPGVLTEVTSINLSATGFDAMISRTTQASTVVYWIAVELP